MSLPNGNDDDDDWGHPSRQPPFGKHDPSKDDFDARLLATPSSEDGATAAETSIGSNSVISGMSSLAPTGNDENVAIIAATPTRPPRQIQAQVQSQQQPTRPQQSLQDDHALILAQRQRYLRQLRNLGLATGTTFVLTILIIIPLPVLLSILLMWGVMAIFLYKLYQVLQWELQLLLQGRGFGDYIPSSIYEQLTQTSFHEFMADTRDSYVNENAYLMLYMIPGLTYEQINEYVGRLSPRHQEILHRQGLGNFLGRDFMRFIMGDERIQQLRIQQENEHDDCLEYAASVSPSSSFTSSGGGSSSSSNNNNGHNIVPRRLELPPTIPEGDDESATSELGHDEDPASQFARYWGMEPGDGSNNNETPTCSRRQSHRGDVNNNNRNDSDAVVVTAGTALPSTQDSETFARQNQQRQQQEAANQEAVDAAAQAVAEAEEQVIYDAIGTAITTYMGVAAGMVSSSARRSATLFSGTIFRASVSMTVLGVGVGIYGFWTGAYHTDTFFQPALQFIQSQIMGTILRPPPRLQLPQSQVLIGSTIASGATASIMLLFQLASTRQNQDSTNRTQDNNRVAAAEELKKRKITHKKHDTGSK